VRQGGNVLCRHLLWIALNPVPLNACKHAAGRAIRDARACWRLCARVHQVNGKMRGTVEVPKDISRDDALAAATAALDNVRAQTEGKDLKKIIFVPGKILNLIVGK
jgi:leucyl-tRNA synthetase